ncbi:hypothetical protein ACIRU3_45865 [Streptomyces sp. NPDC101151]|uniref:hypothetical protein n=1 Tax=Streptomyces sp. NPDC101151 TaxID=3366115 RepID=UPI00382F64CC
MLQNKALQRVQRVRVDPIKWQERIQDSDVGRQSSPGRLIQADSVCVHNRVGCGHLGEDDRLSGRATRAVSDGHKMTLLMHIVDANWIFGPF